MNGLKLFSLGCDVTGLGFSSPHNINISPQNDVIWPSDHDTDLIWLWTGRQCLGKVEAIIIVGISHNSVCIGWLLLVWYCTRPPGTMREWLVVGMSSRNITALQWSNSTDWNGTDTVWFLKVSYGMDVVYVVFRYGRVNYVLARRLELLSEMGSVQESLDLHLWDRRTLLPLLGQYRRGVCLGIIDVNVCDIRLKVRHFPDESVISDIPTCKNW